MTAGWFATIALFSWPLVSLWLFSSQTNARAILWTILGGLLLLPAGQSIKFEMIPAIDKTSIPNLCAMFGCLLCARRDQARSKKYSIVEILLVVYVICPIITSSLNNDPIVIGTTYLPGVGNYDGISALISQVLFIIPFVLGRRYLRSAQDHGAIFTILVTAGLVYSLPALFEIRMSPQLSIWIYGHFPSSFPVEMRYGGFRPVVFMNNGLELAFFMMTCMVAAIAIWRTRERNLPLPPNGISFYLGIVVVLCKASGALVYGGVLGLLTYFSSSRTQVRMAVLLVTLGLLYPTLRITNLFPNNLLVSLASSINQERADSLEFRFANEDRLLAHASERLVFGWGRYGRNRVYDDWSNDQTVTDGRWIITIGQFGLFGFFAEFGLLALPVFFALKAIRVTSTARESLFLATLSLVIAANVIDLLPNASLSSWSWLLAGALLGRSETLIFEAARRKRRDPSRVFKRRVHREPLHPFSTSGALERLGTRFELAGFTRGAFLVLDGSETGLEAFVTV